MPAHPEGERPIESSMGIRLHRAPPHGSEQRGPLPGPAPADTDAPASPMTSFIAPARGEGIAQDDAFGRAEKRDACPGREIDVGLTEKHKIADLIGWCTGPGLQQALETHDL